MEILVLTLYGLALLLLFLYNCGQLSLIIIYLRSERKRRTAVASVVSISLADLPRVTVQLPIYNELYVVERLIDAVAQL
ncbi:MAG: histidine kinase, partial [Spirosoma sp.]|nr:histidine kinase [Spirosoma sp.]